MISLLPSPPPRLAHPAFALDGAGAHGVPWAAARRLLRALRDARGDDAVCEALAPYRPSLGLVLRGLPLSDAERREQDAVSLATIGHLPNMFPDARRLAEAWAGALAPLLDGATLYVPDFTTLDAESAALPRRLSALLGDRLRVVIVAPPVEPPPPDAEPDRASLTAERLHWELRLLLALATPWEDPAHGEPPPPSSTTADPLDDTLEARAWDALASDSTDATELALGAARAAWASYAFPAAFALASAVLDRAPDHPAAAELHAVRGLSLYTASYHQADSVDQARWSLLVSSIESAFALETVPARRAHLLYRLTVARSRFRGAHEEARALADEAVAAAVDPRIPAGVSAFCEAWARNGRALARFRIGDLPGAVEDCEAALARLDVAARAGDVPAAEIDVTRFVVMDNLARVAFLSGDRPRARAWQERCEEVDKRIPLGRKPATIWSLQHTIDNNLEGAIRHFGGRLTQAIEQQNPTEVAYMRHLLADCAYRLGRARDAADGFADVLRLWTLLEDDEGLHLQAALNLAVSRLRAGQLDEARGHFADLLEHPAFEEGDARADLLTGVAYVDALAGDDEAAEARFAEAHGAAETDEVRARVWLTQGGAAAALGRAEDAIAAWKQAIALADASPPEDRFGILASLLATEPERLAEALALAPGALSDPNAWWELPRVAEAVAAAGARGEPPPEDDAAREGLARVREAASQRADARGAVERWAPAWAAVG